MYIFCIDKIQDIRTNDTHNLYDDPHSAPNRGQYMPSHRGQESDAEIRLMGLILSQSALIGVAVGVFDSGLWLTNADHWVNGITYAMAAFAVQGLAYYLFKMFFEHNLQQKVKMSNFQRQQQMQFQDMHASFDQRRVDLEMRRAEAELEKELRWMEQNPGAVPPQYIRGQNLVGADLHNTFNPGVPIHEAETETPLNLGIINDGNPPPVPPGLSPLKKDGTPDLRYKTGAGGV